MRNSETLDLQGPVAVACHDAGAANLITAWLRGWQGELRHCLGGPAARIWDKETPAPRKQSFEEALQGAATLLSGTGWASDLEHEARKRAQNMGVRSIAVLDHWVNYRDRFIRHGEMILPNEIWVADAYAKAEAERCFPGTPVRALPNRYLLDLLEAITAFAPELPAAKPRKVLYVLEPIRRQWGVDPRPGELQAFGYFLEYLARVGGDTAEIVLRPHPSDPPGKYQDWLSRFPGFKISLNGKPSLAEQIAWADWVVGCESFALVVALQAGRLAFSSMPPWAPACSLPHRELRHVRELMGQAS